MRRQNSVWTRWPDIRGVPKSFLAAEAIAAYVEQEEWQLGEIHAAVGELDAGQSVSHEKVATWLKSWGKAGEKKAPR